MTIARSPAARMFSSSTQRRSQTDTEVTGPIRAEIFVSADVPDFDLWVRLLDVAPDGTAFNLMSPGLDVLRASYRNASLKPELAHSRQSLSPQSRSHVNQQCLSRRSPYPRTNLRSLLAAFFAESTNRRIRNHLFANAARPHPHLPRCGTPFSNCFANYSARQAVEKLIVPRSMQHMHRMRQEMRHRIQRLRRAFRTPRQIHDQCLRSHRRHASRKHGRRRQLPTLCAASLPPIPGTIRSATACRRFRRIVPRPNPRTAGRQNHIHAPRVRQFPQLLANIRGIIRNAQHRSHFPVQSAAHCDHRGPGKIFAFPSRNGIADCEHCDAHQAGYFVSTGSRFASSINRIASIKRPVVFFVVVVRDEAFAALKSISNSPAVHSTTR